MGEAHDPGKVYLMCDKKKPYRIILHLCDEFTQEEIEDMAEEESRGPGVIFRERRMLRSLFVSLGVRAEDLFNDEVLLTFPRPDIEGNMTFAVKNLPKYFTHIDSGDYEGGGDEEKITVKEWLGMAGKEKFYWHEAGAKWDAEGKRINRLEEEDRMKYDEIMRGNPFAEEVAREIWNKMSFEERDKLLLSVFAYAPGERFYQKHKAWVLLPKNIKEKLVIKARGNPVVKNMWVVMRATPTSVIEDMVFRVDAKGLELQFKGGLKGEEIYGFDEHEETARAKAQMLLTKRDMSEQARSEGSVRAHYTQRLRNPKESEWKLDSVYGRSEAGAATDMIVHYEALGYQTKLVPKKEVLELWVKGYQRFGRKLENPVGEVLTMVGERCILIETTGGQCSGAMGRVLGLEDGSVMIEGEFKTVPSGTVKIIEYMDEKKARAEGEKDKGVPWRHSFESERIALERVQGGLLMRRKNKALWMKC